jgi:ABC-type multidrug transport system fused ATPase/permease subunit
VIDDFVDSLTGSLSDVGNAIGEWLPRIVAALLVLLVGLFIARWIRRIVGRLLGADAVTNFMDKIGIGEAVRNSGYSVADLGASLIYGFLALVVLLITSQTLGIDALTNLLQALIAWLPRLLVALIILAVAGLIADFVANLVRPWAERKGYGWVDNAIRAGILIFGVLTALDYLGIGGITNTLFTVVSGAAGIVLAIAFGVGGIDTAKQWWNKYAAPRP